MIDLGLTSDGDLKIEGYNLAKIDNVDLVQQRLLVNLKFFFGEWFLDNTKGVPYYGNVLGKPIDPKIAEATIKQAVLSSYGVDELKELKFDLTSSTRALKINLVVIAGGEEITITGLTV